MKNNIEILAPAGSYEGFEAAIGAGADAVYVGGAAFGARAYARNFEQEELLRAIDVAHLHNRKLYLTVNTLLKNRELEEQLYGYLLPFYEAGLDAVIVQDLGVFQFIKQYFDKLPIHASTQMTVTGPEGMKFLEELGAARVVAARELSLEELSQMHKVSPIEIEAFVHGALCYSFSGQCLMSSLFGGRSGNRGRCAQPCRLPYQTASRQGGFRGDKELCPLSLKDICTLDILPEILQAGVISLKIEGRMKQPAYTAGVTGMYRKYVDRLLKEGPQKYGVEARDRQSVLEIFSRGGSCTGYYQMHNGPSMMAFSNEKKTGETATELTRCKRGIQGTIMLFPGSPVILEVHCGEEEVTVSGGEVQFAKNHPMEEKRIREQMEKVGNTEFYWEALDIQMDDHIFVPVKVLNELRREALTLLEQTICGQYRRRKNEEPRRTAVKNHRKNEDPDIYISCEDAKTAEIFLKEAEVKGLYVSFDTMKKCFKAGMEAGKEMYLALPHVMRGDMPEEVRTQISLWMQEGMKGFLVRNLESYACLRMMGYSGNCVIDHSLYTWNNRSVAFWQEQGIVRDTVPLELNEKELQYRDNRHSEMLVYGYLPLMESAQCIQKNLYGCNHREETLRLKDRYGKEFPVVCCCSPWKEKNTKDRGFCYNIIYNSIPLGLFKEGERIRELGMQAVRLSFTVETPGEAGRIYQMFLEAFSHGKTACDVEFTKGHFKRGAE